MADIITNGLQGPSGLNQALHAGMAKRMRSQTRSDDTGLVQVMRSPERDGGLKDGFAGGRHMNLNPAVPDTLDSQPRQP